MNKNKSITSLLVINTILEHYQKGELNFRDGDTKITNNGFKHTITVEGVKFCAYSASKKEAKRNAYTKACEAIGYTVLNK